MKKLIAILLLFNLSLYGFNRIVPLYIGAGSAAKSGLYLFDNESAETFYFNPAIIDNVRLIEISYNATESKISVLSYKYFKKDFGLVLGFLSYPVISHSLKYDMSLYSLNYSTDIGGLMLGLNLNYNRVSISGNNGSSFDFGIGLKKSGLFEGKRIDVSVSYRKGSDIVWKNETQIIEKTPSQVFLGTMLTSENFDLSIGLNYLFPVNINDNVNVITPDYDEELRLSLGFSTFMSLLIRFKLNIGYTQVFDRQLEEVSKKFLGFGIDLPLKKLKIKFGFNSNNIIEKSSEKIENLSIGLVYNFLD